MTLEKEVEEARRRNLADIIEHAAWEAEMVKKMGEEWFKIRDKWLEKALQSDLELLKKNSQIRKALIKAIKKKRSLKGK